MVQIGDVRTDGDADLRGVSGFSGSVPYRTTFSRFFSRLANFQGMVEQCFPAVTSELRQYLPGLRKALAVDATCH